MKKITLISFIIFLLCFQANSQSSWVQKANYGGGINCGSFGFAIGAYGYIGGGNGNAFWRFDTTNNTWTQKANLLQTNWWTAATFVISGKGYTCGGNNMGTILNDLYEYDPATNNWTQKASLPGIARSGATGFSINGKGYICGGISNSGSTIYYKELWEYDPILNSWSQKADIPCTGDGIQAAFGFVIGNKGYVGTGWNTDGFITGVWEYNSLTNIWVQKSDFPSISRCSSVGFAINNKGYVGTGNNIGAYYLSDFWEYTPSTDTWTLQDSIPGGKRTNATGFSIGNKGYLGTGVRGNGSIYLSDFWEYTPKKTTVTINENINNSLKLFPNPVSEELVIEIDGNQSKINFEIYNSVGQLVFKGSLLNKTIVQTGSFATGVYMIKLDNGKTFEFKKMIKE